MCSVFLCRVITHYYRSHAYYCTCGIALGRSTHGCVNDKATKRVNDRVLSIHPCQTCGAGVSGRAITTLFYTREKELLYLRTCCPLIRRTLTAVRLHDVQRKPKCMYNVLLMSKQYIGITLQIAINLLLTLVY